MPTVHIPVMAEEILEYLAPRPGMVLVDGTLGGGGHARLLAQAVAPTGRVLALDRDPAAVEAARESLAELPIEPIHASYAELPEVLAQRDIQHVDGILLDLGLSSDQLADTDRGFSFNDTGELDLRFDRTAGQPAWELIRYLPEKELADLIFEFGEERRSRGIAKAIVLARRQDTIRTAAELAEIVRRAVPPSADSRRIHAATRTFQALRIAVNDEIGQLQRALTDMPALLAPGGRLAIISFHSLEDRPVKQAFKGDVRLSALTKKPLRPNQSELRRNPRSRSASCAWPSGLPKTTEMTTPRDPRGVRSASGGSQGTRPALPAPHPSGIHSTHHYIALFRTRFTPMRARTSRRSPSFAAAAILLLLLLPVGCKPAPTASISGEETAGGSTTPTGQVTTPPTILKPQGDHSTLSPASGQSPSFALPPTSHGISPFDREEEESEDTLPQAALPTSQGPPR